ncbi:MAG: M15 family metallopeptidase [Microbacteriaceae bacterium]
MTVRRAPERVYRRRRRLVFSGAIVAVTIVALVAGAFVGCVATAASAPTPSDSAVGGSATPHPSSAASARPSPTTSAAPLPVDSFDKAAHSLDDPASIWVVVNKSRALNPKSYVPADLEYPDVPYVNHQPLRQEAATALVALFNAAHSDAGLGMSVQSGYRSYDTQVSVYNEDVAAHGVAYADTDTARPGTSEHQTGLAVDISAVPASCSLDACFGTTPQGEWLATNAWRFGFLLRYPADKVPVTGYTYEPWHFRYIGTALSTQMHNTGFTTLEEFFGVPGGTVYPAG